jgi:ABC-type sugar transport system substrate-binding protein
MMAMLKNRGKPAPGRTVPGRSAAGVVGTVLILLTAACSGGTLSDSSTSAGTGTSITSTSQSQCGTVPTVAVKDPDGVVANLPAAYQAGYNGYTGTVYASRWDDWKPATHGPYTIGISLSAETNPYEVELLSSLKQDFSTQSNIGKVITLTSSNNVSDQLSQFRSLIAQKVTMIIYQPLSPGAFIPVVDEAAADGIPSMSVLNTTPDPNTVNIAINGFLQGAEEASGAAKAIGGKGTVLGVHGIPGVAIDTDTYVGVRAAFALCPDITLVDSVTGEFQDSVAQTAVLQYLRSNPRTTISAVVESGPMTTGIISAFEEAGRTVPTVADAGGEKGALAYWSEHKSSYKGVAIGNGAPALAFATVQVAEKMLAGDGIKVSDVPLAPVLITSANLSQWVSPGWTFNTQGTATGPVSSLVPAGLLNAVFSR